MELALGIALDENLRMIEDSVAAACRRVPEVLFDAEHFFDGYLADPDYALACLDAARQGGARWIVLCDTNGGRLPHEIASVVERVAALIPPDQLGIHTHNDTENAVANTIAAVRAGARQVQGTLNGLGERCGNANLIALIPTLMLKMGYATGVSEAGLRRLTEMSRAVDERLNRIPDRHAAYVGACAFTHKAGLHASAVAKDPSSYEHVPPEVVGNQRHVAVSDQAGRANLLTRLGEIGLDAPGEDRLRELLGAVKEREADGYAYEGAEASFELLARRTLGQVPEFFRLSSFRIIDERRYNARNELVTLSEATIKVEVGAARRMIVAEGNGPVHALDTALRQALSPTYPALEHMHLADYKVRILTPEAGTGRGHPGDHRERRRRRSTLVDRGRVDQRDRCLLRRPARRHHLQAVRGRRRGGALNGRPPAATTRGPSTPVIILVRPQLGENVGTTARAMLNFGLTDLRLVRPQCGWPNAKALQAASGATEVLNRLSVFDRVEDAASDLHRLYATTARPRDLPKPVVTAAQAAREARAALQRGEGVGILFGPERTGLSNDDLIYADAVVSIPVNPDFFSLNLAQAVLLVAYEWFESGSMFPIGGRLIRPGGRPPRASSTSCWNT